MSSGGILIAPAAVGVAAAAVAVATVAVAAVLAVRAANAAAEAAVRAVGEYGAELESVAAAQAAADVSSLVWDKVAAEVVEVNARIKMLAQRAARAGVAITLPTPLSLVGLTAAQAAQWSGQAARELGGAQAALRAAVAADEGRAVAAQLPQSVVARPKTAAALAKFQQTLLDRYESKAAAPPTPFVTNADVEAIVRALDPDANEREHADVLGAAAYVVQDDPREARSYLLSLQTKVAAANGAAARRRLAAQWLSALEEPVVAAVEPPGPFLGTAARLRAVVAGDEDLTPQLRAQGAEAVEWAAEVTRQRFVRDVMSKCLSEQGYTVDGEFDLQHSAELRLARSDWHGEHSAEVWVDKHGVVHGRLVREQRVQGDQALSEERSRCVEFNADIATLGSQLNADVVTDDAYVPQDRAVEGSQMYEPKRVVEPIVRRKG